jgi:hypothetical protein
LNKNVNIIGTYEEYIEKEIGLKYKKYPPFRRIRYDINLESVTTGNIHGIFFDRISIKNQEIQLVQCEIEYLRTRSLFENTQYLSELLYLQKYMEEFFRRHKVRAKPTFYSKLSFLQDLYGA